MGEGCPVAAEECSATIRDGCPAGGEGSPMTAGSRV
jgi:hypothetical protein